MFYPGDIQSGIASAMREAKSVVCFIRDDQEESQDWEESYFDEDELRELLSTNAITLRLIAGTQEAGFLTSICPVNKFPAVIVIKNGVLQAYIVAGTSKSDFQTRLKTSISASVYPNNGAVPTPTPTPYPYATQQPSSATPPQTIPTAGHDLNQAHTPIAPTSSSLQTNSGTNSGHPQPSVKIQTNQTTVKSTDEINRQNIRDGKKPEKRLTPEEKKALQEKEDRRAMQLKIQREQKEQREERERIRNQIKHDQEARKRRAEEEKINSSFTASTAKPTMGEASGNSKKGRKQFSEYRLQIRLFDGSSVRNSFPPTATITKDVRPWLDSQRSDGSQPYNLKQILTPLPNRTISVAEEVRSLEELELGPTASLVMVPVPSYIEAYAPTGVMSSLPGRVVSSGYDLVSGVVGGVAGMVGGFLGYGSTSTQSAASDSIENQSPGPTAPKSTSSTRAGNTQKINIRTLHDQWNDRDKNEFYNGNTLNFEPRKDDDSKDK